MREPNLNQTILSFQQRWFKFHGEQGGEEETLETCLKTLYSQEAVKPAGARCPTICTGWSVGISNNYICLYLLDRSENMLYKLCASVLLGPLCYQTSRSYAYLVLGFQTRHGDTNVAFVRPSRTRRHLQGAPPPSGKPTRRVNLCK